MPPPPNVTATPKASRRSASSDVDLPRSRCSSCAARSAGTAILPNGGQRYAISPSRISVSPSVPTAFTSGSRRASGGPKMTPYAKVTSPPKAMQTRYASPVGKRRVVDQRPGDQGAHGSDGSEGEVQHARRPVEHDDADSGQRVHTAQGQARDEVRLVQSRSPSETSDATSALILTYLASLLLDHLPCSGYGLPLVSCGFLFSMSANLRDVRVGGGDLEAPLSDHHLPVLRRRRAVDVCSGCGTGSSRSTTGCRGCPCGSSARPRTPR